MSKLVIKTNDGYVFRDHEDNMHIPEEMMKELKNKMSYEEAIMCFMDTLIDLEYRQSRIDKAIDYINNHQLVFQDSTKKEINEWFRTYYKELLDILKGSDSNE